MSQEKKKRSWATWLLGILLLLVLYVGSTGPVLYFGTRGYFGEDENKVENVFGYVYYPIMYGIEHSPWFHSLFMKWGQMWAA